MIAHAGATFITLADTPEKIQWAKKLVMLYIGLGFTKEYSDPASMILTPICTTDWTLAKNSFAFSQCKTMELGNIKLVISATLFGHYLSTVCVSKTKRQT